MSCAAHSAPGLPPSPPAPQPAAGPMTAIRKGRRPPAPRPAAGSGSGSSGSRACRLRSRMAPRSAAVVASARLPRELRRASTPTSPEPSGSSGVRSSPAEALRLSMRVAAALRVDAGSIPLRIALGSSKNAPQSRAAPSSSLGGRPPCGLRAGLPTALGQRRPHCRSTSTPAFIAATAAAVRLAATPKATRPPTSLQSEKTGPRSPSLPRNTPRIREWCA